MFDILNSNLDDLKTSESEKESVKFIVNLLKYISEEILFFIVKQGVDCT